MDSKTELEKATNEVMRKIGRNVLLYQQVEHLLKYLIVHSRLEGGVSDMMQNYDRRSQNAQTRTLGQSVSKYFESIIGECEERREMDVELKESTFAFNFSIEADSEFTESRKQALASIVEDRNQLIHHLLPRLKPDSVESWIEIGEELDQQREKTLPEFENLKAMVRSLQEGSKAFSDYLNSAEGIRQLELCFIQQSPVVILLEKIAAKLARSDGWTSLSRAGQLLWQQEPELMAEMNEIYGHKTLKALISASELFDVLEEPSHNGGSHALYRLKV